MTTSLEAYQAIKPVLPSLREQVYDVIKSAGEYGATNQELINAILIGDRYMYDGGTITTRPSELARAGKIRLKANEDGTKAVRKNTRGRNEQIWVVV